MKFKLSAVAAALLTGWLIFAGAAAAADAAAKGVVATATFLDPDVNDTLHWGRGTATVYQNRVVLEDNFETAVGPNLNIYLVDQAVVTESAHVVVSEFVDLGILRALKGRQSFNIPAGTDLKKYPHLVIWCEDFQALFSPARLIFRK